MSDRTVRVSTGIREAGALASLAALVLVACAIRLAVGPSTNPWADVFGLVTGHAGSGSADLILEFRLPQAMAAALAGAALALSGLQMQTVFQNPLAGPWALGLVAGAQLGVALLIVSGAVFGLQLSGVLSPVSLSGITIAAAVGSACALAVALKLARRHACHAIDLRTAGQRHGRRYPRICHPPRRRAL